MFEKDDELIFLAVNRQVRKRIKCIDLKHHVAHEVTKDRNETRQGTTCKTHVNHNTTDVSTKNLDTGKFKCNIIELDLGMPMLRERVYGKNMIHN